MKFPLQKGSSQKGLGARRGECPICHKTGGMGEPNSFAIVNAGALLDIGNGAAIPDQRIKAFFDIGYHGSHDETTSKPSARLEIVSDPIMGQFEFYFCSTACLRQFFSECVDELERALQKNK